MDAFERYLLTLDERDAVAHILECIVEAKSDGAWAFMDEYADKGWEKLEGDALLDKIFRAIISLSLRSIAESFREAKNG